MNNRLTAKERQQQARIDVWRSQEASNRAQERATN